MGTKISVLLVNLNNLSYTKQCLEDLLNQDIVFNLRLVDQNSSETGTKEFFDSFFTKHLNGDFYGKINYLEISNTGFNKPLNHLWNEYVKESSTEFICLLNNDVRIPPNFLSSSISVLEKEPSVGFVNHVTNNLTYSSWSDSLEYVIMETPYRQGWDPIFRKSCYNEIPEELKFFYGDDYIYSKLYSLGYKGAYVLNSPIIHFERSTTEEKGGRRDCSEDGNTFYLLDIEHKNLKFNEELCRWKPETTFIKKDTQKKIKLFDFCIFNNEHEILELRLNYMSSFIDKFYVCEIDITHQSKQSEFYSYEFIKNSNIAKKLIEENRLIFVRLHMEPSDEYFAVEKNHRIKFSNWVKENIKDEFVGILSDCDEIISKDIELYLDKIKNVTRLELKMFYFTADNHSFLHPWDFLVKSFHSDNLLEYDFQSMRDMGSINKINNIGWHFSCFGGINQVIDKIKSFSHIEYNNSNNTKIDIITNRIINRKDYLGRDEYPCIKYNVEDYPEYLMKFLKEKKHLLFIEELLNKEKIKINSISYMEHFYKELGENWFTYPNLYSYVVNKFPSGSHFIEVGVWKGMSASYMAVEIINSGKKIKFDCVDNWEFIENLQSDISQESFRENIYDTFLKNINPVQHIITPIKELSWDGAKHYKDSSLDFVFIDAAHDYESVKKDINAWFPKIKKGGIIAGHDYAWSDDVKKAVNEFFDYNEIYETEGCWIYFTEPPLIEMNFWKNAQKNN
jgi:GT2 family glycosyltransferase/predicted O-methyltransferase YrrM